MSEDYQSKRSKTWSRLNATRHFIFGLLLMALAVFLIQNHHFGTIDLGVGMSYALGGLLIVYGIFRIWRGIADLRADGQED